jgi:hypothetical protein
MCRWGKAALALAMIFTAAPAFATTYFYDDSEVFFSAEDTFPAPPFGHGVNGCCDELSASVVFNFDTSTTSGTFVVGDAEIFSADIVAPGFLGAPHLDKDRDH